MSPSSSSMKARARLAATAFFELPPITLNLIVADEFRKASSLSLALIVSGSNATPGEKISSSNLKATLVPVLPLSSDSGRLASGASATPRSNDCVCSCPSRQTVTRSADDSALTTDTPTPWRPPDTR